MNKVFIFLLLFLINDAFSNPMESIEKYNVIIVHGAAVSASGMDCENETFDEVFDIELANDGYFARLKGIGDHSPATGMIKHLPKWLAQNVFEGDKTRAYLQRQFTKPATAPSHNGREIGDSRWPLGTPNADNGCAARRSLIEEIQEYRAGGASELKKIRDNPFVFRDSTNYPTRNILIAHSMGGVASREYVQSDYYNGDVDKVITLDSPHKGTYALDGLIDLKSWMIDPRLEAFTQIASAGLLTGLAAVLASKDPFVNDQAFKIAAAVSLTGAAVNSIAQLIVDVGLGYDYYSSDGLVPYIKPGSEPLKSLNNRPYMDDQPMYRVLYSTGGLTVGGPEEYGQGVASFFIPDAVYVPTKNIIAQISHTEIDNPAYFSNIIGSATLGAVAGLPMTDHGSVLIPHWSGAAEGIKALDDPRADVKRYHYDGNKHNNSIETQVIGIWSACMAGLIAGDMIGGAIGLGVESAVFLGSVVASSAYIATIATSTGLDMSWNHRAPTLPEDQSQWFGATNSYTHIDGTQETVTPYLMEEFLYEKPFVNIRVTNANDWLEEPIETNQDSIGFYSAPDGSDEYKSIKVIDQNITKSSPLVFNSDADWETMGVKKDRWVRVDGVEGPNSVPIRHVDRYKMPDLSVDYFIEQYRFVVDDLMPNRLRQIRINFNFQEDIAWDCDVTKPFDFDKACKLFKRTSNGEGWKFIDDEPHPVKKDGTFDFTASEYYENLLQIQKDNQNVVSITTINKIGLKNSQRFYYLFKATADHVQPVWPLPNVKVTGIDGFSIFASVLDYPGFTIQNAEDQFIKDNLGEDPNGAGNETPANFLAMNIINEAENGDKTFGSQQTEVPSEGEKWRWNVNIFSADATSENTNTVNIPFVVDVTPPSISVEAEKEVVNPEFESFIGRFRNDVSIDPSLRLVRFWLDKLDANGDISEQFELPPVTNAISGEFAISAEGLDIADLSGGNYRLNAMAMDHSVPNREKWEAFNELISITDQQKPQDEWLAAWNQIAASEGSREPANGFNHSQASVDFIVDTEEPVITDVLLSVEESPIEKPAYQADQNGGDPETELVLNKDQLLKVDFKIAENLYGREKSPVAFTMEFVSVSDETKVHRTGDTVWITSNEAQPYTWIEQEELGIPQGSYNLKLIFMDEAQNRSEVEVPQTITIERIPPAITELISKQLVYAEDENEFSASLYVSQTGELEATRSDLSCYYRVRQVGQSTPDWTYIGSEKNSKNQTNGLPAKLIFDISPLLVGAENGKRYLESGCVDLAGNFASRTDLFHVGALSPSLLAPISTSEITENLVAISGLAPAPNIITTEGNGSYRLQWKAAGDADWKTDGIDVGPGRRSESTTPWISNEPQPTDGVLGFWDRTGLEPGEYNLQLSTRSCPVCEWISDEKTVVLGYTDIPSTPAEIIVSSPASIVAGGDEEFISMRIDGGDSREFRARLYAEDANGTPLFEASSARMSQSPFEGRPSADLIADGIWFWSEQGDYHLVWNGLPAEKSIEVQYIQDQISTTCQNEAGTTISNCIIEERTPVDLSVDLDEVYATAGVSTAPEMKNLQGLNAAMVISEPSGHLVFESRDGFQINLANLLNEEGELDLSYWIGTSQEPGLNVSGYQLSAPTFSVQPDMYGLVFKWNGLSSTGKYPEGGNVRLYAEAIENSVNGKVIQKTSVMQVTLPDLQVVSPTSEQLPDFFTVSGGEEALVLGNKVLKYGIQGRNANVSAVVKNQDGQIIKTLLESETQNASINTSAYQVIWDGTDDQGHVVTEAGTYSFEVSAVEKNGDQTSLLTRSFTLSVAPGMTEISGTSPEESYQSILQIPQAITDPNYADQLLYTPQADYLVRAKVAGKFLPENLRTLTVRHSISGKQNAKGYPAQRFSLAVQRKRDELDLRIIYKIDAIVQTHTDGAKPKWEKPKRTEIFGEWNKHSAKGQRKTMFGHLIDVSANDKEYGFHNEITEDGVTFTEAPRITLYAFLLKDAAGKSIDYLLKGDGKNSDLWKKTIEIPWTDETNDAPVVSVSNDALGCIVADPELDDGSTGYFCEYTNKDDGTLKATENYNPNANLFNVSLIPRGTDVKGNKSFVDDWNELYSVYLFNGERYNKLKFGVRLVVPEEYWDPGFGYDNLVNRTIRIDHTNITMFGDYGYLKALETMVNNHEDQSLDGYRDWIYYNGNEWLPNTYYGLLTPFEALNIPFISAEYLAGGLNTFLFAGEQGPSYLYDSYFKFKFYGNSEIGDFHAQVLGIPENPEDCTTVDEHGQCVTDLSASQGIVKSTPLLKHGTINVKVGLDATPADFNEFTQPVDFPLSLNWNEAGEKLDDVTCPEVGETNAGKWREFSGPITECHKYYDAASQVNYYVGDYDVGDWNSAFLSGGVIKNPLNSTELFPVDNVSLAFPEFDVAKAGTGGGDQLKQITMATSRYEKGHFYQKKEIIGRPELIPGISGQSIATTVEGVDSETAYWNEDTQRLEVKASEWVDPALVENNIEYHRLESITSDTTLPTPTHNTEIALDALYRAQTDIKNLYDKDNSLFFWDDNVKRWRQNNWIKDVEIQELRVLELDSTRHSHFEAEKNDIDETSLPSIFLKRKSEIEDKRGHELVAVHGRVPGSGTNYQLSYLNKGDFHTLKSENMPENRGTEDMAPILSWFDVNRLQGNTSLILSWGGLGGQNLNFRKVDLNIGSPTGTSNIVTSLYGELSVTFPMGSLTERKDVTVRTVSPLDYNFDVFNNVTLRGPVIEVLPSMSFPAQGPFPRIKMKLSRSELSYEQAQDPSRIKLYKVDFENGQFMPLENVLYGFLTADGEPAIDGINECSDLNSCTYAEDWAYLLVSGETKTFSEFVALDEATLISGQESISASPLVSKQLEREVFVSGVENYQLFCDDDGNWANEEDNSPPVPCAFEERDGMNFITLPEGQLNTWVYLVAYENGEPLAGQPKSVRLQLVPNDIQCTVSEEVVWLGIDNGYLELPQSCNQDGMGVLQLWDSPKMVNELSSPFTESILWDGSIGLNKITHGHYTTRYIAINLLGQQAQTIGPMVYTDSYRPEIKDISFEESAFSLERVYSISGSITDDLSGVAKAELLWKLGEVELTTQNVNLEEDGAFSSQFTITQEQLSNCLGCEVTAFLYAEDYGHNNSTDEWRGGAVWPYPRDLAFWYSAQEGAGSVVEEKIGSGADLDISTLGNPWNSSYGLYFYRQDDAAKSVTQLNLGTSDEWSLEMWIRPGYSSRTQWQRILGWDLEGSIVQLQMKDGDLQLVDGSETITASGIVRQQKVWSHIVVTANSETIKFFRDGQLYKTVQGSFDPHTWSGDFSLGKREGTVNPAFVGHLSHIRFYKRALLAGEISGLFQGFTTESDANTDILLASELIAGSGVVHDVNCAAPGTNILSVESETGVVSGSFYTPASGEYQLVLYARSTVSGNQLIEVVPNNASSMTGSVALENVWRSLLVSGVNFTLGQGVHTISLNMPEGMQVAGIAIMPEALAVPGRVSWKDADVPTAGNSLMAAEVKLEGSPDPSMIRPRIRLTNTSATAINGFQVRYYFRGEDPTQVRADQYYPSGQEDLNVYSETDQISYASWAFPDVVVQPGQSPFYAQGPHFGLHNSDYSTWVAEDDPSFVANGGDYENAPGILVLSSDNQLIGGSCFEEESPIETEPKVQVWAKDTRESDNQATHLYIRMENIGPVSIKGYKVRYSFYVPNGLEPVLDVYDMQGGLSAELKSLGAGKWQVEIVDSEPIGPSTDWQNPAQFAIHLPGWTNSWDHTDDPSHQGISGEWSLSPSIEVFDKDENRIYGRAPEWPYEVVSGENNSIFLARVMAKDVGGEQSNSSSVRMFVENLGSQTLTDFSMKYWFTADPEKVLGPEYYNNNESTPSIEDYGDGNYSANFVFSNRNLAQNETTDYGDGLELFLHYADWSEWDSSNDHSFSGLSTEFSESRNITLYDSENKLIWGMEPSLQTGSGVIPALTVVKTADGLGIVLEESAMLELALVNISGILSEYIYQGQMEKGEHHINLDWQTIDQTTTYLMIRLNGSLISTDLLSEL